MTTLDSRVKILLWITFPLWFPIAIIPYNPHDKWPGWKEIFNKTKNRKKPKMKKTAVMIAMALSLMVSGVNANILYVYGKVDTVTGVNPLIKVGDAAYFRIVYSPTFAVSNATVTVNDSMLNLARINDGSTVFIDENPADGTVQWSLSNSPVISIDVASNTPGGVIPCIDNFDLGRTFQIFFNGIIANGTVTSKPVTRTGN